MIRKLAFTVIIALLFLSFIIWKIDWSTIDQIFRNINISLLVFGFLILFIANFIRSIRFSTLDLHGHSVARWWIITQLYNAITATLPGGAGEAVTIYTLKQTSLMNISGSIRILLLTRLMDLSSLSALFLFVSFQFNTIKPHQQTACFISSTIFLITMIMLTPKTEKSLLKITTKVLSNKFRFVRKIRNSIVDLITNIELNKKKNAYYISLLLSGILIVCAALSVHIILRSIGVNFNWQESFYCLGVYALFQLIPIQGIAGLGTQAAWWAFALKAAGYTGNDTLTLGVILYVVFYIFILILSLLALIYWIVSTQIFLKNRDHVS